MLRGAGIFDYAHVGFYDKNAQGDYVTLAGMFSLYHTTFVHSLFRISQT